MEEFNYQTMQELLEDYYNRLLSSKEKDPKKNPLFQQMLQQIEVFAKGKEMLSPYEQYLSNDFITFWKTWHFDQRLEEYKTHFIHRLSVTTYREKLFELETKGLDKYDVFDDTLSGDISKDGEKLGHLLAIKGDNPTISKLIHNLSPYHFGIEHVTALTPGELLHEDYWHRRQRNYSQIFSKLQSVCQGYLDAQKLNYLRQLQSAPLPNNNHEEDNDTASSRLTLKQQILVIHSLGVFELGSVRDMTVQNQGKLFGRLFGRNEKNTEDIIRRREGKNVEKKYSLEGREVTSAVKDLFDEVKPKL